MPEWRVRLGDTECNWSFGGRVDTIELADIVNSSKWNAHGDAQLAANNVHPCDALGHGMLDLRSIHSVTAVSNISIIWVAQHLQTRVQFQECISVSL